MSFFFVMTLTAQAFLELHPAPQQALFRRTSLFPLQQDLPIVVDDVAQKDLVGTLSVLDKVLLQKPRTISASQFTLGDRAIYMGLVGNHTMFSQRSLRGMFPDSSKLPSEGYFLRIQRNGIFILGKDRAGLIHGIHMLAKIINESRRLQLNQRGIPALPYAEIMDYPHLPIRGIHVNRQLRTEDIQHLSELQCNLIIVESDDFYDMNEVALATWNPIFDAANTAGITIVPLIQLFHVPSIVLLRNPRAIEGRTRVDRLALSDTQWNTLSRNHVIFTPENPIRVSADNRPLTMDQEYTIFEGDLFFPFPIDGALPWKIKLLSDQSRVVDVMYSHASPGSSALCPMARETRQVMQETIKKLVDGLSPPLIHFGFGDIKRLNQDLRCRDTRKSNAEIVAQGFHLLYSLARDVHPTIRTLIWADALCPPPQGPTHGTHSLHPALDSLPKTVELIPRVIPHEITENGIQSLQNIFRNHTLAAVAVSFTSKAQAYAAIQELVKTKSMGIVLLEYRREDEATRLALERAWSCPPQNLVWPEKLNTVFNSALWQPTFSEAKEVILDFIESRILPGSSPKTIREGVLHSTSSLRQSPKGVSVETNQVLSFFELALRYLELEYEWATGNTRGSFRELPRLIDQLATVDAFLDADRTLRIQSTIKEQGRFVPASVLFGRSLAYYRPFTPPQNTIPCEIPVQISYTDKTGSSEATIDFLIPQGPIFRLDFETLDADSISVSGSDDGLSYEPLQTKALVGSNQKRGPLFFPSLPIARFLRVHVSSSGSPSILREIRPFALLRPSEAKCPYISDERGMPPSQGRFIGTLRIAKTQLPVAPTEIFIARRTNDLTIRIHACDPLPHAMSATHRYHDAPLWEEESVEIIIRNPGKPARRFIVNPLDSRYEAMTVAENISEWDPGWDAEWHADSSVIENGWESVLVIPFTILGGTPQSGDNWDMNFIRHRNNVEKETSFWVIPEGRLQAAYGVVSFE